MYWSRENGLQNPVRNSKALQARIIRGSVVLLSGSSLSTAINLAYNIALAHFLGPKGFGNATAVYTLLTLISAVTLSFQIVSAKTVAQQESKEGKDAVYLDLHRMGWACGIVVALLLVLFKARITEYLNLPSPMLVLLLAIGAAFYVPLGSRRGYIQGAYGFGSLARNLVLEGAVRLVGSLVIIQMGYGVTGVIAANAAAIAVAYLALAPKLGKRSPNPLHLGYAFRETAQAMVFFSGQVLINNCDIVLVKHLFEPKAAGLYAAIAMVGRVIFAFSSAVVNSMFPVVAGTGKEERKNLSLIGTSLLLVLAIGSVLAVGLRLTPAWIWTSLFGSGFELPGLHGFPYLLALYAIATVIYSLSVVIITYEMSYKIANSSWIQLIFGGILIAGIGRFHSSLGQVILVQLIVAAVLLLLVGIPFLVGALRNPKVLARADLRSVRLLRAISEDEVISEFLKSDFDDAAYLKYRDSLKEIIVAPDLVDRNQNAKRRALLLLRHGALWKELPAGTQWFEVEIREADISQIRMFPRAQWRKIARGNFAATEVVERMRHRHASSQDPFVRKIRTMREGLFQQDLVKGAVVLIGLNETEPMTIIDGNHRFVAAVLEGRVDRLRFVCGLSPNMTRCCWYRTNPITLMLYGRNLLWNFFRRPEAELESPS